MVIDVAAESERSRHACRWADYGISMSQGPWGQDPSDRPGRGGRRQPPDLEELIRKSQERLEQIFRGGGRPGRGSGRSRWLALALMAAMAWLYMSTNAVKPDENGLVLRLGAYNRTAGPGLHFVLWPLERMERLPVEAENQINLGGGTGDALTLAGDQNLVDIRFSVLWKIKDARDFLFNVADQVALVTRISESAMREIVGRTPADEIRTRGRQLAQDQVRDLIQKTLDDYKSGIVITGVQLEKADPPQQVLSSFEEVQRAEQNQNKLIREAEQYRNQILGQARGEASKVVEEAKAYKARVVAEAQGEAQRFLSVLEEYSKAKDVTRQRLFIETLEDVLQKSNRVIIDNGKSGQGIVPYLALPEIEKKGTTASSKARVQ
jgi:modulator of FtsH protease HflK